VRDPFPVRPTDGNGEGAGVEQWWRAVVTTLS
jgi:hypothetical protein